MPTREEILRGIQKLDQEISKAERELETVRAKKRALIEAYDLVHRNSFGLWHAGLMVSDVLHAVE